MNWEQLMALYNHHDPEVENVSFLPSVDRIDNLGPILVGMANTSGGKVVVGMDFKNVHLRGCTLTEEMVMNTLETFFNRPFPIEFSEIYRGEKYIMAIDVSKSARKPHYYKDKCYIYKHDIARLASPEEEELMGHETRTIQRTIDTPEPKETELITKNTESKPDVATEAATTLIEDKPLIHANDTCILEKDSFEPQYTTTDTAYPEFTSPEETRQTLEDFIIHLNKRQRKALKYLKENKSIRNKVYRKLGAVSHKTAHIELTEMLRYGLIRSQGNGRSTHYVLNR